MDRIHILIVDDHAMFRDGLRAVLEPQEDMSLVGEANDAESAIRLAAELRPDVILMDLHLPGRSGVEATREIRANQPSVKVIALTMYHDDSLVDAVIQASAQGYVLKEARPAELLTAIRAVAAGGAAMDPSVASQVLERYRQETGGAPARGARDFSDRELTLLRLLAEGASNRSIAAGLHLTDLARLRTAHDRWQMLVSQAGQRNGIGYPARFLHSRQASWAAQTGIGIDHPALGGGSGPSRMWYIVR